MHKQTQNRFTAFFRDYLGEPVPEEIFFRTLRCKGMVNITGIHTEYTAGRHSIRTNHRPTSSFSLTVLLSLSGSVSVLLDSYSETGC